MNDLVGFKKETIALLNKFNLKNLHSSIIIHGPKGIGKNLFVNNFINEIFKKQFKDNTYYHHYNLFKNNTHPNIKLLEKLYDVKTKKYKSNIGIEQIRDLKKFINDSPSIQNFSKFIIIDCADDLNINASNSFLKNLEEPNKDTFIFLICHRLSSIIPTIRSRCLKIKLNQHSFENFKIILLNRFEKIEIDEIKFLYDLTYGSPGTAIFLYEEEVIEILDLTLNSLETSDINKNKVFVSDILSKFDNEKFKSYLSLLKSLLVIMKKFKNNPDEIDFYLSNKLNLLKHLSNKLTEKNIVDRFNFLIKNEHDLFTLNLDKKLFMLKFLTH